MKLTNRHGLPDWLVESVRHVQSQYSQGKTTDYSTTSLAEPPMITGLKYQYADRLEQDVTESLASFLGSCVHDSIEHALKDGGRYLVEQRFYRTIHVPDSPTKKDFVISGQIDLYNLETQHLTDHKVTSYYKVALGDRKDWEAQASVNRWLMWVNGYNPQSFSIAAFLRDHRAGESKRSADYPNFPFQEINIPFWSEEKTEQYIRNAVLEKERAKQGVMRPCSREERWQQPSKWVIYRKGRKSSIRNLDSYKEAQQYVEEKGLKDVWIEQRRGEAIRCNSYCPVSQFCSQKGEI